MASAPASMYASATERLSLSGAADERDSGDHQTFCSHVREVNGGDLGTNERCLPSFEQRGSKQAVLFETHLSSMMQALTPRSSSTDCES